ncbi:NYN domain-containing protein [Methanosphaera cuniculi]|uniref:Zc3h12a-like ribonuclease n=1 Tax=Methanosphaera cuniculi TaxID=1077256 RepID=A0A2A2HC15_9EURY|nr:Zc3h12a-like ribonuclease [Methanosphaera cuniculi]PAV06949.1 Zc3h12a-like ribonuclease [Methanosphaera cuniculi]PWL08721.1 Zc3h12a-like ribonuclease NYN domain protein [Methanosphaera cuniculi]
MKIIVDGSNVAYYGQKPNEETGKVTPSLKTLKVAIHTLKKLGHEPLVLADAPLRHEIDDKDGFNEMIQNEEVFPVPAGTIADHYILNLAYEEDAKILSNDFFREYQDEFQDISSRRLPYRVKDGRFQIGKPSPPKKVKNILQKICSKSLNEFESRGFDVYKSKRNNKFSGLAVAQEAINRVNDEEENAIDTKLENVFMKIPILNKLVGIVDEEIEDSDFLIFVLVNPKDYKEAVKNAGTIAVTVKNKLGLDHSPLVAVRNDLFTRPGAFELNIIYSDEILEESPYNLDIIINDSDYSFIKHNSRNIASTLAGRLGTWKFPRVAVKPSMLMEKPGQFEVSIERGGKN